MRKSLVLVVAVLFAGIACAPQASNGGAPAADQAATPPGPPPPIDLGPVQVGTAPDNPYSAEQIERGRSLVTFGSCNDCHTPWIADPTTGLPAPDMSRMLSGHPHNVPGPHAKPEQGDSAVFGPTFTSFALPFGTVYSLNLTPDIETGTGSWTEEMFLSIFRKARHLGGDGRTILPPMPWPSVASLSDEDLVSIFAYLRSIPPVVNAVPTSEIPQPVLDALAKSNDAVLAQMRAAAMQ